MTAEQRRTGRILSARPLVAACWFIAAASSQGQASSLPTSTVGMPQQIEQLVLPGGILQVRPLQDRHQPFVLRIIETYPHGTDHRYDLEYYALEPGQYNLADYLQRADGSGTEDLPSLLVRVESTLAAGQTLPSPPAAAKVGWIGGYRWGLVLAGVGWLAGLAALLFLGRRRQAKHRVVAEVQESPADRMRRLLAEVQDRTLSKERGAELERNVIAFWREELGLQQTSSAELIQAIRRDDEAAAMLDDLGRLLHRPDRDEEIDLDQLLQPIDRRLRARSTAAAADSNTDPVGSRRDEATAQ